MQNSEIGSCDGAHSVANVGNPRDGAAEVETQRQAHAHVDFSAQAFDDADDIGVRSADGHEVNEAHCAGAGLEGGFEDQGVRRDSGA